ncbi:hypothetical protein AAC387_Pa11g0201 [Persea americana]
MENTCPTLPSDIIYEVLTRVPLQSLQSFRQVCAEWRQMIHQTYFIKLHSERTKTLNGYFIQSLEKNKYYSSFVSMNKNPSVSTPSLEFLPKNVKIEASSSIHGLLCCTIQDRPIGYLICKPATKEWRKIPNPKVRYFTERIEIVVQSSAPLQYKIIRFSQPNHNKDHLICEIFDSQSWKWRRSIDIKMGYFDELLSLGSGVLMNGSLHWLTNYNRIFAFDVANENWKMISLPQQQLSINEDFLNKKVVEYEGYLSLCYYKETWMELWVMKDSIREVWERKKTINIEEYQPIFEDLYTSEVAFLLDVFKVIWYNFQLHKSTETKISRTIAQEAYIYKSDLTPLIHTR